MRDVYFSLIPKMLGLDARPLINSQVRE